MPRGEKTKPERTARRRGLTAAAPSPELGARLEQARILRDPRVRALWPQLETAQQYVVHDPTDAVGHRFPISSGELAELTSLSERQVRYWADRGLIPHWKKGRRRLFEAVGLITAFAITNAKQHEIQFYRSVMEEPLETLTAKVGILTSLLASRIEHAEPGEAEALTAPLDTLTQH